MDVPPEIAFRGMEANDNLKERILAGIEELETVHDRLVSCRVAVEDTTASRQSGKIYRVRLELRVPNQTVVVDRQPDDPDEARDLTQVMNEAFDIARRRLRQLKEKQRDQGKGRELPPHGRVIKLMTHDDGARYGFLMAGDGREIYFHENALSGLDYDQLETGTEVRYTESMGEHGPQASAVAPLDLRKVGKRQDEDIPLQTPHEE